TRAHSPITTAAPNTGSSTQSSLPRTFFIPSSLQAVDGETLRISLQISRRIELLPVEHGPGRIIAPAVRVADLLHRLFVEIRPHDRLGHAGVIGRAWDHAPTPELGQPPLGVGRLRIIAVAFAEMHRRLVRPRPAVAVVELAQQPAQDDLLVTVDVG